MAKIERELQGDFDTVLIDIDRAILDGSLSAELEDSSYFTVQGARCAVKVYERYSAFGGNRVSLTVTLMQGAAGTPIYASAITAGGSQAVFLKINTVGEEAFLECAEEAFSKWECRTPRRAWE